MRLFFVPACCILSLTFFAMPAPAAEKAKPGAPVEVSPALKAFEKSLNALGKEAQAAFEGPGPDGFAPITALLDKLKAVPTAGLPEDLKKAFTDFCAPMAVFEEFAKALPKDLPPGPGGLKKWMDEKEESDPEAVQRLRDLQQKVSAAGEANAKMAKDFESLATRYGLDIRAFLEPDSIGRQPLKPAEGDTTVPQFVKDFSSAQAGNAKIFKEPGMKTMGDLATRMRETAELYFSIPTGGLPEDLRAAILGYAKEVERYSWILADYPADLPVENTEMAKYITEKLATDKDFNKTLNRISARGKKRKANLDESKAELARIARLHKLDLFKTAGGAQNKPGESK